MSFEQTALSAATSYAAELSAGGLAEMQGGPPRWVFADDACNLAVRVAVNSDGSLDKLRAEYTLLARLRNLGAQVMRFVGEPQTVEGYDVYATEYLPSEEVTAFDYGRAMASLHTAGHDPECQAMSAPFRPLARTRQAFDYLSGTNVHPSLLPLSQNEPFMEQFKVALVRGETAAERMLQLAIERGYPLTITQQDTHPGNVRNDNNGVATLIDLSGLMVGPAEIDFGRLQQWSQRFGMAPELAEQFMAGYRDGAERQPDPELIELAYIIADVRYAALSATQIEGLARGVVPSPEKLRQVTERIMHLGEPDFAWVPQGRLVVPEK